MTAPPVATYRVQLHAGFAFDQAAALAGYLADLGISHLYCSPYLQAAPGSIHGYDVVDHNRLNAELGGHEAHARMTATLKGSGMGQILDIVPNHMAASPVDNPWWWDVLKHGRDSPYADYFDIDWGAPERRQRGLIMLPVLRNHYGIVLGSGDLTIVDHHGQPAVAYFDGRYPLTPGSLAGTEPDEANADPVLLHEILERQHYRLAYWRSDRELNYRRFFDVNELIAVKMGRQPVFDDAHRLVLGLVETGILDGLRIDHVDGLRDPLAYLERLRARAGDALIYVEKILGENETLPPEWPVDGSTGYDFANAVTGLFVDPAAEDALSGLYRGFTGVDPSFEDIAHDQKLMVMRDLLEADIARLTEMFVSICDAEPGYRDFTRQEARTAIEAVLAGFDVYRTYVQPERDEVAERDIERVEAAAEVAAARSHADPMLLRFLVDVLTLRHRSEEADEFVLRLQQASGSIMAKAVEDTAFYVYNRFVALNEVGGRPHVFGTSVAAFHRLNARTQAHRPLTMLATSTHDTKRSEDVRARLVALSEIPDRWAETVWRWAELNERHRSGGLPDRNAEYLLYQTLAGAWPIEPGRAVEYMRKASKEAKEHTSWIDPVTAYDEALEAFVRGVVGDEAFVEELTSLVAVLAEPARVTSLAQTLLKLTSPGVPDIYQGCELWDLSLVDPDNRRPVDYEARRAMLAGIASAGPEEVWERRVEGAPKQFVVARALALRAGLPDAFGPAGDYVPLAAEGERAEHVVAFARGGRAVTVVPRLVLSLGGDWGATTFRLPEGRWRDVFTGDRRSGETPVAELLGRFPVSLMERVEA